MENFAELFDYNFSQYRDAMLQTIPQEFGSYMREETTTRPFERRGTLGGLGLPVKNRDAQPLPFSDPVKGHTSVFVPVTYRLAYMIDQQSVEDELYGMLADRPRTMLQGSIVIKDMVASDILNNGLTLQGYDLGGTPLFSNAHTREDGGGTYSNLINTAQPITVETVFNAIGSLLEQMTDYRGNFITMGNSVNIYVPMNNTTLWQQAVEVQRSINNPGTSDNKINAVTSEFTINVVKLRYLTNPNVWFIGYAPNTPNYGLVLFNRIQPQISPLKMLGDNPDVWFSRLRMRFTAGYESKRGIAAIGAA